MGEEDRGSSGSGTMVIVLAILAGILVLGCCGGVVVVGVGGSFFLVRSDVRAVQDEAMMQPMTAPPEMQETLEKVEQDLQPLKITPDSLDEPLRTELPSADPDIKGLDAVPGPGEKLIERKE